MSCVPCYQEGNVFKVKISKIECLHKLYFAAEFHSSQLFGVLFWAGHVLFTVLSDFLTSLGKNPFSFQESRMCLFCIMTPKVVLVRWKGWQSLNICITLIAVYLSGSVLSLSPLLQAAVLIVQQIKRGLGLAKSFYRACWEVYGRSQQLQINQKVKILCLKAFPRSSR